MTGVEGVAVLFAGKFRVTLGGKGVRQSDCRSYCMLPKIFIPSTNCSLRGNKIAKSSLLIRRKVEPSIFRSVKSVSDSTIYGSS